MKFPRATRQVVVTIAGTTHWLWRAVDQNGHVLHILVQSRRNRAAGKRLLRTLLKTQCRPPSVMMTDHLGSYGAAKAIMPGVEHSKHNGLNTGAEHAHQPTRRGERQMTRFTSAGQARCFLSAHDGINTLPTSVLAVSAAQHRTARARGLQPWAEATGVARAA